MLRSELRAEIRGYESELSVAGKVHVKVGRLETDEAQRRKSIETTWKKLFQKQKEDAHYYKTEYTATVGERAKFEKELEQARKGGGARPVSA